MNSPVTPSTDDRLAAHIARLKAELRELENAEEAVCTWHGHAVQLRRVTPGGWHQLIFSGSLTQCIKYWRRVKHKLRVNNGRVWIEDCAEPAVVRSGPGPKRRAA